MDIGSFLQTFRQLCNPNPESELYGLLASTINAYDGMFILHRIGQGSPQAMTGMNLVWPRKTTYQEDPDKYSYVINDLTANSPYALPAFLTKYLDTQTPSTGDGSDAYCLNSASSDLVPQRDGQLLLNPALSETDVSISVQSDLSINTDDVFTLYVPIRSCWLCLPQDGAEAA